MDYRVVQFAYSSSSAFKIRKGFTKAMLREALKGELPDGIRTRISKLGFATPQSDWMEAELNQYFKQYFARMNNPYLDNKYIAKDFDSYPKSVLHSWDFSRFYIFDKWYQTHFSQEL
jgi:asparagine synthase (glutamine-hydrolysing)